MVTASYSPGLHILSELTTKNTGLLKDAGSFMEFIHEAIGKAGLHELGDVVYSFDNAGFTAVVCLTESHLSIHTWPEFNRLTFDVFLSNFMKENDRICRDMFHKVRTYFESEIIHVHELKR